MSISEPSRFARSVRNRQIAGVCSGLADYFQVDTGFVRLIWVVAGLMTGIFPFVIAYVVLIFVIPPQAATNVWPDRA